MIKIFFSLIAALLLSACDTGVKQMGPTEAGVVFRRLPVELGGGISKSVIPSAQKVVVWPWDTIYRFDTSEKYVSWGSSGLGRTGQTNTPETIALVNVVMPSTGKGYVYTRAIDGNEVALAVTVVYRIIPVPEKLVTLVKEVATSNEEVRDLVIAIGRADIRTHMNHLRTAEFADAGRRYDAVHQVQEEMNKRLNKYGIEITKVTLDDFQFERLLRDGTSVDSSYQEKLTLIQKTVEETAREKSRILTVKALKEKEYNDALLKKNQIIQEAEGYLEQAKLRADAYRATRENEAQGIRAKGVKEAQGLTEQIAALSGVGGEAMLKIELAKQILKGDPKFVLLGQGTNKQGIEVRRTDTNDVITQMGLFEALGSKTKVAQVAPAVPETKMDLTK